LKYPLDFFDEVEKSLLFWIERYIRYKLVNLSNRNLTDKKKFFEILQLLITGTKSIEHLKDLVKEIRNLGVNGVNTYFNPLYKFYYYIKDLQLASLKEIDEELIADFLAINTANLSDATKKNHRIALINFFKFIDKNNIANENSEFGYIFNIELKNWAGLSGKSGIKLPYFLTEDEIHKFIKAIDEYKFSHKIGARNRLILKIILYTGIRVSEAINLLKKDIILDNDIYLIQVRGKGNKPRVVMVKKDVIEKDLIEWDSIRDCNDGLFFCNSKGNKLTQAYISRQVEQILSSIGIRKEKNGAHLLRHSFATLLYQKHKDLVLVQEALGHADLNTSRIYTHFDKDRLKKATEII